MKTYLVEGYSPDLKFDKGSTIIALTPEVCYQLTKAGIKYSIIEDYYDEVKLSAGVDEYYESQLQWIDDLDRFLQSNVKELKESNLKLGTLYYYFIKTMVLDPLYIRSYALNRLLEVVKPSSITYISTPSQEIPLDFSLQSHGKSYYSQLIPLLCGENNIPLTPVLVKPSGKAIKKTRSGLSGRGLIIQLGSKLYRSTIIRRLYFNYQYFSKRSLPRQKSRNGLNIFILKLAHIGVDFVIDALRRGHCVYQLSDNLILKYSSLGAKRYSYLRTDDKGSSIWENTASLLEGHDLIKMVGEKCQVDTSEIVLPKLKYFVSKVCPEILNYLKMFAGFYEKERIDFVITPHEVSPIEFAAIAAANSGEYVKTVHISHGDDVYNVKFWRIWELTHADLLISSNREAQEYFDLLREQNSLSTNLYSSPHRFLDIKRIRDLREKKKNRIIYLPTLMMGDTRRIDGSTYPDTWYYEFQKSVMEYFSTKSGYIFVWKGLPQSDAICNPIPDFIRDNNFGNIEVSTSPFTEHLLPADRVICDYPSTGFYEAVVAGVPTIALYHRALLARKSALDYFGNLLRPFSNAEEAIKHIDEFLDSDSELYKMTLDVEDKRIIDILEEVSGKAD